MDRLEKINNLCSSEFKRFNLTCHQFPMLWCQVKVNLQPEVAESWHFQRLSTGSGETAWCMKWLVNKLHLDHRRCRNITLLWPPQHHDPFTGVLSDKTCSRQDRAPL